MQSELFQNQVDMAVHMHIRTLLLTLLRGFRHSLNFILSTQEIAYTYVSEADILNMALFGKTAAQWRAEKGIVGKTPNIKDFASVKE